MARLYEYQGKEFFKRCGIPVPRGKVVISEQAVEETFGEIGGRPRRDWSGRSRSALPVELGIKKRGCEGLWHLAKRKMGLQVG